MPDRWSRLIAEHHRQAEVREEVAAARSKEGSWFRTYTLTVGGVFAVLLLVVVVWMSLEDATRRDPSRCDAVPEAADSKVSRGGWAEPDRCSYFDEAGEQIRRDADLAGPVTRTYDDVVDDNVVAIVAIGLLLSAGTAAGVAHWARRA